MSSGLVTGGRDQIIHRGTDVHYVPSLRRNVIPLGGNPLRYHYNLQEGVQDEASRGEEPGVRGPFGARFVGGIGHSVTGTAVRLDVGPHGTGWELLVKIASEAPIHDL